MRAKRGVGDWKHRGEEFDVAYRELDARLKQLGLGDYDYCLLMRDGDGGHIRTNVEDLDILDFLSEFTHSMVHVTKALREESVKGGS